MRHASRAGRACVLPEGSGCDPQPASYGRLRAGPNARVAEIPKWLDAGVTVTAAETVRPQELDATAPKPGSIGLNSAEHATEPGLDAPTQLPPVFTRITSSITGEYGEAALHDPLGGRGRRGARSPHARRPARGRLRPPCGPDLSGWARQLSGPAPQFGLAKSCPAPGVALETGAEDIGRRRHVIR